MPHVGLASPHPAKAMLGLVSDKLKKTIPPRSNSLTPPPDLIHRDLSHGSTSSSSSALTEVGLDTPPASPQARSRGGKAMQQADKDNANSSAAASLPSHPQPLTRAYSTLAPAPTPSPSTLPRRRPTREEEEEARGRSRWPRLLWQSSLDMSALIVLDTYHERTRGCPLPRLVADIQSDPERERAGKRWSRELEKAGL